MEKLTLSGLKNHIPVQGYSREIRNNLFESFIEIRENGEVTLSVKDLVNQITNFGFDAFIHSDILGYLQKNGILSGSAFISNVLRDQVKYVSNYMDFLGLETLQKLNEINKTPHSSIIFSDLFSKFEGVILSPEQIELSKQVQNLTGDKIYENCILNEFLENDKRLLKSYINSRFYAGYNFQRKDENCLELKLPIVSKEFNFIPNFFNPVMLNWKNGIYGPKGLEFRADGSELISLSPPIVISVKKEDYSLISKNLDQRLEEEGLIPFPLEGTKEYEKLSNIVNLYRL